MHREPPGEMNTKSGVELFSDMMLMKFKPKNLTKASPQPSKVIEPGKIKTGGEIKYLELASKDSVVIGNSSQVDLINIDGLSHNFVDTFYYWSLSVGKPILDVKVSIKKQLLLILTRKAVLLYGFNTIKRQKGDPTFLGSFEVQHEVRYIQFPTSDLIAIFYDRHFEIYSLSDSMQVSKKLEKQYGLGDKFSLFAVPQAIDHTINVFFEETQDRKNTFGLWCMEIRLLTDNIKINPIYKIYDIMKALKKVLLLENYSNDIVFLNLGQEILVARKGYIVDSVSINLQIESSYLRYLPRRKVLVHIEKNSVDLYSFKINLTAIPQRIQLTSLDSLQVPNRRGTASRLISLVPILDHNFALFYEDTATRLTTRGEVFYSFVVSHTVDLKAKVSRILQGKVAEMDEAELETKCDVLRKMGMSDQQIYLQIWRRSSRSTVKDFQFILATRDYKTIKGEIEAKLKKQSMSFKEVLKIEESCLSILKPKIDSEQCNQELLKDYFTCSLLLRKLTLYRDLHLQSSNEEKLLFLNIQDYYNLKNMQLKDFVLERLTQFLTGKSTILPLRLILNHFRFVYRFIYPDLLEHIIKASKNQLRTVLQAMPELLPIDVRKVSKPDNSQDVLYQGVWSQIKEEEWERGEHLEKIANVYNREAIEQFVEGLWFKRNWLTYHDFIPRSASQIQQSNLRTNSVDIFYYFIDRTFQTIKQPAVLKSTLSYLQKTYDRLPQHLCNKILLYVTLYRYYSQNWEAARCPQFTFAQFLRLKDFNLFKFFFELEKGKKNCLLREIKPIYEQVCGRERGFKFFNQSLLSYFRWEQSEISNLKYLLNRINNEKKEFHIAHEQMYQVLVSAMQFKLRIGSGSDIPIEEVLIYVENIPISKDNKNMIQQLQLIQKISQHADLFRKMRVNMTIREIIDNYQTVIEKIVNFKINQYKVLTLDMKNAIKTTYRILAQVQSVKENIYGDDHNELAFFIYLTKLLEHEMKIPLARDILCDEYLNNYFFIDSKIIESLVLYMYRWNFAQDPSFVKGASYINQLSQLLPQDNPMREYLLAELQFALLLSTPKEPVTYPIVAETSPRVVDLEEILKFVDNEHLVKIEICRVIEAMKRLEEVSHNISELHRSSLLNRSSIRSEKIEEAAVYRTFINIFISRGLVKQAVPIIRTSLSPSERSDTVTILILIYHLLPELNEQSKHLLIKICSFLYSQPLRLLDILERFLTTKLTGLESIAFLNKELDPLQQNNINFSEENLVFNVYFMHLNEQREKRNKMYLVSNSLAKLKKIRTQFQHEFIYDLIFIILCYEPYSISIFLRYVKSPKWRYIRSFISHLIQQEIFDQLNVLQAFKRIFYILLRSFKEKQDIYRLTAHYSDKSLIEQFKIHKYQRQSLTDFEKKVERNALAFQKKKNKVLSLQRSVSHQKKNAIGDKAASIKEAILHPEQRKQKTANEYVFSDSDDNYEHEDQDEKFSQDQQSPRKKPNRPIIFDPKSQRKNFIRKDQKANIQSRKQSPKKINHLTSKEFIEMGQPGQSNEFAKHIQKNNSKIKKYNSLEVRAGYDADIPCQDNGKNITQPLSRTPDKRKEATPRKNKIMSEKTLPSFEERVIRHKSKQFEKLDQLQKKLLGDEEDDIYLPNLEIQNKASQRENQTKLINNLKSSSQIAAQAIVKKIYRTFDEKNENQPYNLKVLYTEKEKTNGRDHIDLFNKIARKIYEEPERTIQIALKLIIQMAKAFPQLQINTQNAEIFEKIAKLKIKYGLEVQMENFLRFQVLYLNNKTPEELFAYTKDSIMEICDQENIFKLSKLISIGFKKNTIEQQVIFLYLQKIIKGLNLSQRYEDLQRGLETIKAVVSKVPVRTLVERTEGIIDQCTHIDLRRKLVEIFIENIRIKGNGKDAKQLANKLK